MRDTPSATCHPDSPTLEEIEAEVAEAIAATRAKVAELKPRDSMPLAGFRRDWSA